MGWGGGVNGFEFCREIGRNNVHVGSGLKVKLTV